MHEMMVAASIFSNPTKEEIVLGMKDESQSLFFALEWSKDEGIYFNFRTLYGMLS